MNNLAISICLGYLLCGHSATAAAAPPPPIELSGYTMGQIAYKVLLAELPGWVDRASIQSQIDQRLELINDQMSTYRPDSELSRFNRHQQTDWFPVSRDVVRVVAAAQRTSELSGGAFDATVGPLVDLWNFGPSPRSFQVPGTQVIERALTRVGYARIQVRQTPPALRKDHPQTSLDLSAIAKGFAVDKVSAYLEALGVSGYLVEIGGEARAKGLKPGGAYWAIGIEKPTELSRSVYRRLNLVDAAVATSGDYRNYFEHEGKRYSHTIDPRTGRPVEFGLASVSVICVDCMQADALATAIMVLGADEGYRWAVAQGLPALLIVRTPKGFAEKMTPTFRQLSDLRQQSALPTFLVAFVCFAAAVIAMSVGVLFSNRRLKGSCGGITSLRDADGNLLCDACQTPSEACAAAPAAEDDDFQPP